MPSTRTWLPKILALGLSLTVAVGMIEVLVRVAGLDAPLVWRPDPVLGWWHIPGARMHWTDEGDGQVEINALGMRDVERTATKPAGVFRIAVFGDSMTEGVQVNLDKTYTQVLEARLKQRGMRAEVLNFGVNGYSPLQDFLLYQRVGEVFAPDLVIFATFLDNDVADGRLDLATGQAGGPIARAGDVLSIDYGGAEASSTDYYREPIHTLRRASALYRLVSKVRNRNVRENVAVAGNTAGGGVPKRFLLYADPLSQPWTDAWTTFDHILSAFQARVRADGREFAVLSVPAGQVVDDRQWADLLMRFPAMAERHWQVRGAEQQLQTLTTRHGIRLIAPLEEFRRELPGEPLFFGGIGHFTPRGHAVMAAALDRAIGTRK